MSSLSEKILGKKVAGTRVVPLMLKIVAVFTTFLLVSNISTNYINLSLNQAKQIELLNKLLIADLQDIHVAAGNQFEIYEFNQDLAAAVDNIRATASAQLEGEYPIALGVRPNGEIFMAAYSEDSRISEETPGFSDAQQLEAMNSELALGLTDNLFRFTYQDNKYIGVYKFHPSWNVFFIRGEAEQEFYAETIHYFRIILLIILVITVIIIVVGVLILQRILKFVGEITNQIMAMQDRQAMDLVDLRGAPNDEVAYLGIAFNSLATTIENLLTIFRKFVARDVAQKAYREREIRLEGTKRELAILFSDIKSFTFMTEVLGNDIIRLLNLHYEDAIRCIHDNNGDIGSIIGDALLAVFGVIGRDNENKYFQAIKSGYEVVAVAAKVREEMSKTYQQLIRDRGALSEQEERVYKAVMIEVGVGIDGGEVFYGNIGSNERMVNTVIGDNVNSASRLEGLTRVYKVPVICSEYVKEQVEKDFDHYHFLELDLVQVKGKTVGKRIYWPLDTRRMEPDFMKRCEIFSQGLAQYYAGDWKAAAKSFELCDLPQAEVFKMRTASLKAPKGWSGIWTMTEK